MYDGRASDAHKPDSTRKVPFRFSLGFALSGVLYVLRAERNAKIEVAIGALAVVAGLFFRISPVEWAILSLCIALVLALETFNTAVEATVDLVTRDQHDLAKRAKDAAAGAVLFAVLGSLGVGVAIFLPRIWRLLLLLIDNDWIG